MYDVYDTWRRTCCCHRDRSFAQNKTEPPCGQRRWSIGMRWYGVRWAQYGECLSYWIEPRNGIHIQYELGGVGRAGRTVIPRHGVDVLLPCWFHLGEGSTCARTQVSSFARPDRPLTRTALRELYLAWSELYLFHQRYNKERRHHFCIEETSGGR